MYCARKAGCVLDQIKNDAIHKLIQSTNTILNYINNIHKHTYKYQCSHSVSETEVRSEPERPESTYLLNIRNYNIVTTHFLRLISGRLLEKTHSTQHNS